MRAAAGDLNTLHSWLENSCIPIGFCVDDERANRLLQIFNEMDESDFQEKCY